MTEPTQKPEGPRLRKLSLAAGGVLILFVLAVVALLRIVPAPHTPADYLMAGSVATMLALLVLFALLVGLAPGTFFRRRQR